MTDVPFRYDESTLSSCARSSLAASIVSRTGEGGGGGGGKEDDDEACYELFRMHAAHYGQHDGIADGVIESSSSEVSFLDHSSPSSSQSSVRERSSRFDRFVSSVVFVHEHNKSSTAAGSSGSEGTNSGGQQRHRVSLNRFSDRLVHELPLMVDDSRAKDLFPDFDSIPLLWNGHDLQNEEDGSMYTRLDSGASVLSIASKLGLSSALAELAELDLDPTGSRTTGGGHRRTSQYAAEHNNKQHKKHPKKFNEELLRPLPGTDGRSDSGGDPILITSSKRDRKSLYLERTAGKHTLRKDVMDQSDATFTDGIDDVDDNGSSSSAKNRFDKHLDWSTEKNPDGVPIVHSVMDQGSCGSCWAIAATGTVEANAARREAFGAYSKAEAKLTAKYGAGKHRNERRVRLEAVDDARTAERAAIRRANLSAQELVDCDVRYDQGCTGGNPLLAFYFIHKYGLTSSKVYPYVGKQRTCQVELVQKPVATTKSWGVLTPNHEANMELVLRYIGPIAVGVNGGDMGFLSYEGGIFDSTDCGQDANHAMLITGYGQERDAKTGKKVKYWIARNSWGRGWGEDGYVRMKRGSGKKGREGVCGIARGPSVALGSSLLQVEEQKGGSSSRYKAVHEKGKPRVYTREDHEWVGDGIEVKRLVVKGFDYGQFLFGFATALFILTLGISVTYLFKIRPKKRDGDDVDTSSKPGPPESEKLQDESSLLLQKNGATASTPSAQAYGSSA